MQAAVTSHRSAALKSNRIIKKISSSKLIWALLAKIKLDFIDGSIKQ